MRSEILVFHVFYIGEEYLQSQDLIKDKRPYFQLCIDSNQDPNTAFTPLQKAYDFHDLSSRILDHLDNSSILDRYVIQFSDLARLELSKKERDTLERILIPPRYFLTARSD